VREYGYTVTEHDAERPWIVLKQRHETVELDEHVTFLEWAAAPYPRERFSVQLDPSALARKRLTAARVGPA
jgi:hypothetical protein